MLQLAYSGTVENRGEYWAAYNNEFGIVTYGASRVEAETKTDHAITLLLNALVRKGRDHLEARFRAGGIQYLLVPIEDEPPIFRYTRQSAREFVTA